MNSNIFYFHTLNSIGGIESFFYQLGKKYGKDFDITVYYHSADLAQVERLSQFVKSVTGRPSDASGHSCASISTS